MNERLQAYVLIHVSVLLYGLTGIFGDLITLPKPTLVWWRMLMAAGFFLFWPGIFSKIRQLNWKEIGGMVGIGALVAAHWVTFFGAIALTNPSVTLAVLATGSFFTAILEPLLTGTRFQWYELLLGVLVIPGVIIVHQSADFALSGILVALLSAFLAALFSVLNKRIVNRYDSVMITFVELGSGWAVLCLVLPFLYLYEPDMRFFPNGMDLTYLSILAFLCTSLAYVFTLRALKVLSTFAVNLTINLEPVYTIVLAFFLLNDSEELHWSFYIGALILIGAVFAHPLLTRHFERGPGAATAKG